MIYELRTYHATPGKLDALNRRFADHTIDLFARHGIEVVGFWTPDAAVDTLVYLVRFPDRAAMQKSWDAFRADPDWQRAKGESEKDGSLVARLESQVLVPTDYSKPLN